MAQEDLAVDGREDLHTAGEGDLSENGAKDDAALLVSGCNCTYFLIFHVLKL